jgi:hypothetical protein
MRTERKHNLQTSKEATENRTRNFPYCDAVSQPTAGGVEDVAYQNKLRFEELLKNCSLISGEVRNNSIFHRGSVSPGSHPPSFSFSGRRSGTRREKRETEKLISSI